MKLSLSDLKSTGGAKSIFVGLLLIGVFAVGIYATTSTHSVDAVKKIIDECAGVEGDRGTCYEREVPTLYPKLGISQIFDVVRQIRAHDRSYQFCHVLAHKLGERVVAEDPNAWVDAIAHNPPDGLCSNGYVHGVVGGRFRAEVLTEAQVDALVPDFKRACEPRSGWQPSGLDRAICYHGMGHLYDFITDANLLKALDLCSRTTPSNHERVCIEGVFMQIYQPLEPDDYLMLERMPERPSTTTVPEFCSRFTDPAYEGACLRESWPYFRKEITGGKGIEKFCSYQPNAEQADNCYQSAFSIVGRMSLGKPEQAAEACDNAPAERQGMCYWIVAQAVLEEDRTAARETVELCERAPDDVMRTCLDTVTSHAQFIFGPSAEELGRFCEALPSEWHTACASQRIPRQ